MYWFHIKFILYHSGPMDIEMKDLVTKYANDVIATSAFGIKINTLEEPDNLFYKMGQTISNVTGFWTSLKFFALMTVPKLLKVISIKYDV